MTASGWQSVETDIHVYPGRRRQNDPRIQRQFVDLASEDVFKTGLADPKS
jgi:hypothetical protein